MSRFRDAIHVQIAAGQTGGGYEDALASLLPIVNMRYENVSDLPWVEIDFPADVERAHSLVRAGLV